MSVMDLKSRFPVFRHHPPLAYLDGAASAQKPDTVIAGMKEFTECFYSNVHRSAHKLAEASTRTYEAARAGAARLIAAGRDEIILTSGTTQGINMVARMLEPTLSEGDEIVVTLLEHHSNFVPWQQIAKRTGATFRVIPLTPDGEIDMEEAASLITPRTKVLAFAHVSNVLGTILPAIELITFLRERSPGAYAVVDGAQAVPHMKVDVKQLDADFYVCSAHKMYGPTGVGILYGKSEHLVALDPPAWGGEMVDQVTVEQTTFADPPAKYEPGTPNIMGAAGLVSAITFIEEFGYDRIAAHERELVSYALAKIAVIPGLTLLGPTDPSRRGTSISFVLDGWHPHDLAEVLDSSDIAIRAGHHCAEPLHCALGIEASARASISLCTTRDDIDRLAHALLECTHREDASDVANDSLVRQHIMEHALHSKNERVIASADAHALGKNPTCGDTLEIYLTLKDGVIADASFKDAARSCAISRASASILTKRLIGKRVEEVSDITLRDVSAMIGIDFSTRPVRAKCAMLGLRTAQQALRGKI